MILLTECDGTFLVLQITLFTCFPLVPDPVHAAVQPSGQATPPEVVHGAAREGQEEDLARAHRLNPHQEAEDVIIPRVEGPQDRIQKVCIIKRAYSMIN